MKNKLADPDCEICEGTGENEFGDDCLCVRQKRSKRLEEQELDNTD